MLRAKLVWSTRRMERIPEEDETFDVGAGGSNLGSDPPAQRFAANHRRAAANLFLPNCFDNSRKHASRVLFESGTLRP